MNWEMEVVCIMRQTCTKTNTFEDFYANLPVRLVAYLVDSLLVLLTVSVVIRFPLWLISFNTNSELFFWYKPFVFHFTILDVVCYIIGMAYFILLTYLTGSTLGKKLFNLTVISNDTESLGLFQVVYRETIGRFLSSILCIGYLIILGDEKKQGIHDKLADTYVIYNKKVRITRVMNMVPPHPNMMSRPMPVANSYSANPLNTSPVNTPPGKSLEKSILPNNSNLQDNSNLQNNTIENSNLQNNTLETTGTEHVQVDKIHLEKNDLQ